MSVALLVLASLPATLPQEPQPLLGAGIPGMNAAQRSAFNAGKQEFDAPFTVADGLGPVFNGASCVECHGFPNSGGFSARKVTRFAQANPFDPLQSLGGGLLQEFSIDPANCLEILPPQADLVIFRMTPALYGAGLLEAIADGDIIANAANQQPPLSGRTRNNIPLEDPTGTVRIGRFGWKVNRATVKSFSAGALSGEMSVTTSFLMNEVPPQGDPALAVLCDTVSEPEDVPDAMGVTKLDRMTDFQRFLAAPPQTPRSGHPGEALFGQIGCADCHVAQYTTVGNVEGPLANQPIQPYSNFLLHDMGTLGDGFREGNAAQQLEMGTRTLWGMAFRTELLHDGRADDPDFAARARQAIVAHDGEAAPSSAAWAALSAQDQALLLGFLQSLGRAEFDADVDNDRDGADWDLLFPMLTGLNPAQPIAPEDAAAIADVDQDGDFDLREFGQFSESFGRLAPTARLNTQFDLEILSSGASSVSVEPGGVLAFEIVGELSDGGSDGLAYFAIDLSIGGGGSFVSASSAPAGMAPFEALTNPDGFGGVAAAGELLQLGGSQNSIGNTTAPAPLGPLVRDVAQPGSPAILGEGRLVAPMASGTYSLRVLAVRAGLIRQGASAGQSGPVRRASEGVWTDLIVEVRPGVGTNYCLANANSTGGTAAMAASGSPVVADNDLTLAAGSLPFNSFGFFLASRTAGFSANPGGSSGNLCLGGAIGRYVGPGQIQTSGSLGASRLELDLTSMPQPNGFVAAMPGETWRFTYWYRDAIGGSATSNFADGLEVDFQ